MFPAESPTNFDHLYQILSVLADGHLHSEAALAQHIGVSRTTIWQWINLLRRYQTDIVHATENGYRLRYRYDMLDPNRIRHLLRNSNTCFHTRIEFFPILDSTNHYLLEKIKTGDIHRRVVLADYQTQGQGSRGRRWISPLGCGLTISIGATIALAAADISRLSAVIGVGVICALKQHVKELFQLKWPNDIMFNGRKLGGILLALKRSKNSCYHLVVGIGLNMRFPHRMQDTIEQPWIDLASITDRPPSRNQLAASLIEQIYLVLANNPSDHTANIATQWQAYDYCYGKQVELSLYDQKICGIAHGIDEQGQLLLTVAGAIQRFSVGEITVRVQ